MKCKRLLFSLLIMAIYVAACAPAQAPKTASQAGAASPPPSPVAKPATQTAATAISQEVRQLLDKSSAKVSSIYYMYKGPETADFYFDFYIKGSRIKYLPHRSITALDKPESYNSIYIDTAAGTAQSYCDDRTCLYKGKKGDLGYGTTYIWTMFDWIGSISSANKIGEEVIDDRNTWKVATNAGTFWLDTFYGIPLKIEANGKTYRFQQLAVNSVQDSDVKPS